MYFKDGIFREKVVSNIGIANEIESNTRFR